MADEIIDTESDSAVKQRQALINKAVLQDDAASDEPAEQQFVGSGDEPSESEDADVIAAEPDAADQSSLGLSENISGDGPDRAPLSGSAKITDDVLIGGESPLGPEEKTAAPTVAAPPSDETPQSTEVVSDEGADQATSPVVELTEDAPSTSDSAAVEKNVDVRKIIVATSFFSAALVLGVVVPLGYFGQQALDLKLEKGQSEVKSIITELKTEALKEIQIAADQAAKDLAKNGNQTRAAIVASLETLKIYIDELRGDQQKFFENIKTTSDAIPSEVKSVMINLKTETLKEIQIATEQAAKDLVKTGIQTDPAIVASLETLKTNIDEFRGDQQLLFDKMKSHSDAIAPDVSMPPPGSRDDTLNQTVLFPTGKITGPIIDQQIATMTPKISEYSITGKCLSNVTGFSDTLGGDKSNLELSRKRAMHVATLLREQQIPVGDVKGWGERWLKVHTVDGIKNEQNRRVVIETICEEKTFKSAKANF